MRYRKLGRSDLTVSVVAMGCWAIVGDQTWGPQDESDTLAAFDAAMEAGINFFDTAEGYGSGYSEQLLGRALRHRRAEAVIATKAVGDHLRPEQLEAACDASLDRLGTDYIDLYLVHWPLRDIPLADTLGAMDTLRNKGKVRAVGVSNFGPRDMDEALADHRFEANQMSYSLLARGVEFEVIPQCAEHAISLLAYSPLAQGLLTGKFASADEVPVGRARTRHFADSREQARHGEPGCEQATFEAVAGIRRVADRLGVSMADLSLAWVLAQPTVASVLAGARNPRQVRENAVAAEIDLDESTLRELDQITRPVKNALGSNIDLWCGGDDSRIR